MNMHIKSDSSDISELSDKVQKNELCEPFYESGKCKERWTQQHGK